MANPTLLSRLLCADADKNTIPDTDAGTAGVFSQQYGWQAINSLPLSAGGKAVQRQDFNGVFNLLGGIAFYAQKGYTFEWDIDQDYYANCVVTDPLDGNKYNAKNDVAKGGSNPSLDSTNWELFGDTTGMLTREITPAFNTRDVITTSGTYTAPVTGWYKITAKGGGGGGGGASTGASSQYYGGGGGGEGGTTIAYVNMTAGDIATMVIGAGGGGGAYNVNGSDGGDTAVTIDGNTYTGAGGKGGASASYGGAGGNGTIIGTAGNSGGSEYPSANCSGGAGGGQGGAPFIGGSPSTIRNGLTGGGGAGAHSSNDNGGGAGGDGYVWFEYFATV